MAWIEKRAEFQKRFDELSQENIQGLITELNQATANYIGQGGISQDPNNNPDYTTIEQLSKKAEDIKQRYIQLNNDITQYIASESKNNNLTGLLTENGELQQHINKLEKVQNDMKVEVESAIARDDLLRSRNVDITSHKLFLLGRPIRRGLIPYLWVIIVLFIGAGIIIFKATMPTLSISGIATTNGTQLSIPEQIMLFFSNKMVLGSLLTSALIVILFLSLKIAGVFGK